MRTAIKVTYKGKTLTFAEWSKKVGIAVNVLSERYRKGDRGEHLFRPVPRIYIKSPSGIEKPLHRWCREFGIPIRKAYKRYVLGFSFEDIFSKENLSGKRKEVLNGFTYKGETKPLLFWCKEFKVSYATVIYRIANKWPEDTLFEKSDRAGNNSKIVVTFAGKTQSLALWCRELDVNYATAFQRYNLGLPAHVVLSKEKREAECRLQQNWENRLKAIEHQVKAEKELRQAMLGKMRRARWLLFKKYLRDAYEETTMKIAV